MRTALVSPVLCLVSTVAVLLTGCATNRPTISTWRDSDLTPTRADKIALSIQPNASPETVELGRLLAAELKREGYHLVPVEQADYLMAYTAEDESVAQGRSVTMTLPASPPQTTGQVMDQSVTGGQSTGPTFPGATVSQPVIFRNRGVRMFCYCNPKIHPGGFQIVWQGYIAAGPTVTAERETALIKTLLGYLGREYHGPVHLAQ